DYYCHSGDDNVF
nr:immunoglobulin light chain junction region [Macaca mulatta]